LLGDVVAAVKTFFCSDTGRNKNTNEMNSIMCVFVFFTGCFVLMHECFKCNEYRTKQIESDDSHDGHDSDCDNADDEDDEDDEEEDEEDEEDEDEKED